MKIIIYNVWIFINAVGRMMFQTFCEICYGVVYPFKQLAKQIIDKYGREDR